MVKLRFKPVAPVCTPSFGVEKDMGAVRRAWGDVPFVFLINKRRENMHVFLSFSKVKCATLLRERDGGAAEEVAQERENLKASSTPSAESPTQGLIP